MHRASIKAGPADAEIPASFAGIADHLGVLEHFKFALNVAFFVRHEYFLHPKTGRLQEVSRESVHIYPAVIEGAGGYFTDWNGNALSFDMDGRVIAAGDRARLNEASSILSYIGG